MRIYGLIGYPLTHSFSKKYFSEKFARESSSDAMFENYAIPQLTDLKKILAENPSLRGLAVTIPYKKAVLSLLDYKDPVVAKTDACNCIRIREGRLYGYNTDVIGFEQSFVKKLQPGHTKALVLGTGGAAAAVAWVLEKRSMPFRFVSRRPSAGQLSYAAVTKEIMETYPVIINCSPVGTFPNTTEAPRIPYEYLTPNHYLFDLVYNPPRTKFLQEGIRRGAVTENGYEMLVYQAAENWRIWNLPATE